MTEAAGPLILETERPGVVVRELWTEDDDAAYQSSYTASREALAVVDPLAFLRHRTPFDTTRVREDSKALGRVITGIWDGDTFVASVDYRPQPDGSVELGYWTDSRRTGRKYASLGTAALVAHLSQSYQRIFTRVRPGNEASAHVSENAGLRRVAQAAGWLTFELISDRPNPFPGILGAAHAVRYGDYKIIDGTDLPVVVRPRDLKLVVAGTKLNHDPLPGVHNRGVYGGSGPAAGKPMVSFRYLQLDERGAVSTAERVILWEGIGYGLRSGHPGKHPTWYLVGPGVGRIHHQTGQLISMPGRDMELAAEHFAIACIADGPFGVPLLANPEQLQAAK